MDYISEKLVNSGFYEYEIKNAREKAEKLDRNEILDIDNRKTKKKNEERQLTFLINRNGYMCTKIKEILKNSRNDIEQLLGKMKLVVAERKNGNIASSVFAKSAFSKDSAAVKPDQKCQKKNCKSCEIMNIQKTVLLWKNNADYTRKIKLDYKSDCSTECVIHIYICNICQDNKSFYIGQTVNSCQKRANGHRACFNDKNFKKSALSFHIYKDHPECKDKKLLNYKLGILRSCNASDLDRTEDYFVETLKANLSLNRYKVT